MLLLKQAQNNIEIKCFYKERRVYHGVFFEHIFIIDIIF